MSLCLSLSFNFYFKIQALLYVLNFNIFNPDYYTQQDKQPTITLLT